MTNILQKENKELRKIAREVPFSDITSTKIKKIVRDMKNTLALHDEGVALAAPQIGVPLRIFVVSSKVFYTEGETEKERKKHKDLVFINPVIAKISKEKSVVEEGCLSIQNLFGTMKRAKKVTVKAFDEKGGKFSIGSSGFLAQIFQHEIDHLNGVLFVDSATDIREIKTEENGKK